MVGQTVLRRLRDRRLLWGLGTVIGLGFAAWLAGLAWFISILPTRVEDATRTTQAIVVLTGGGGRIAEGLDLLAADRAQKLFISGVGAAVDMQEILRVSQRPQADIACCVTLGYEAETTYGNAIETAGWMRDNGLRSLRLVTAAYHMPRSLLQFRRAMPEMEIIPHPVFSENFDPESWLRWSGSASVIVTEYSKYLVALAVNRGGGWQE
jgi:uncharacterized SAM-binding protein YcdF (DUF218 family)